LEYEYFRCSASDKKFIHSEGSSSNFMADLSNRGIIIEVPALGQYLFLLEFASVKMVNPFKGE